MSAVNVPLWQDSLYAAARAFRLGMEGVGSENLTEFIDALAPLLENLSGEVLTRLNGFLSATCSAQSRRDFLRVADLLEYEIAPLLNI
jgi:hypothetical protein